MKVEKRNIEVSKLVHNNGQVKGVPQNPRCIDESDFGLLKDSIERSPEYLHVRPLIVVEQQGAFVILCGNMRYEACKALGLAEIPCKIIPFDTPARKMRAYITKENVAFGQDDREAMKEFTLEELNTVGKGFYLTKPIDIDDMIGEDTRCEIRVVIPKDKAELKKEIKEALQQAVKEFEDVKVR